MAVAAAATRRQQLPRLHVDGDVTATTAAATIAAAAALGSPAGRLLTLIPLFHTVRSSVTVRVFSTSPACLGYPKNAETFAFGFAGFTGRPLYGEWR